MISAHAKTSSTTVQQALVQVAVPGPFFAGLTYLIDAAIDIDACMGCRVEVPLGSRKVVGVIIAKQTQNQTIAPKLKRVMRMIDTTPIFEPALFQLLLWVHHYYHSPLGEVFHTALPTLLTHGARFCGETQTVCQLTPEGRATPLSTLTRAAKQRDCLDCLHQHPNGLTLPALKKVGISTRVISALKQKQWLQVIEKETIPTPCIATQPPRTLNEAQQSAFMSIYQQLDTFKVSLLNGITGSGKTEVYMHLIEKVLAKGKQILVLVPEISLTPQTLSRFQKRFNVVVGIVHSKLNDKARLTQAYYSASGTAKIIVGTRSAVFLPTQQLGLIVVDEEHDLSYKQQSGLQYHARDVAIMRAKLANVPIILGSATPSMESYYHARTARYQSLLLPERAGIATPPHYHLIDLKKQPLHGGLSPPLIEAIRKHLRQKQQVLLFLNRRGYAPVLMCRDCGWSASCQRCDRFLTLHKQPVFLSCHHCGQSQALPKDCPDCHAEALGTIGEGTEKVEEALHALFPDKKLLRIDRSSAGKKEQLHSLLQSAHDQQADILIGTQMLAKGHHFKGVTMVGIINIDQGLYSTDFRAIERVGQLVCQVAGRAGREAIQGEVYLQTHQPTHPLLLTLLRSGYNAFLNALIDERAHSHWPPFSHLILIAAQAHHPKKPMTFLTEIKTRFQQHAHAENITFLGPVPAIMAKKSGYYRAHLVLRSPSRPALRALVQALNAYRYTQKNNAIRWSINVDPQTLG